MAGLAVNVDHVATIRQARKGINYPDPVSAAVFVELAGADGVVVHLREDRRHIQERDVRILRQTVKTKLILEMAATDEMVRIAQDIKPDSVTLVPEKRQELTTEGGLDLKINQTRNFDVVNLLQKSGIAVSIFIDPEPEQIKLAKQFHADMVEIHTGKFCDAKIEHEKKTEFTRIKESVNIANALNLGVNAGHGLCYQSIKWFKGMGSCINEFSIGHSIVSRAVLVGMERAVREMVALIEKL